MQGSKLYGFVGMVSSKYFDNFEQLNQWMNENKRIGYVCTIEYIGNYSGKDNAIKEISSTGFITVYSMETNDKYDTYNKSTKSWESHNGNISNMYDAFAKNGIETEQSFVKQKVLYK